MSGLTDEQLQIDAALETWFYPGEFDSRVKAVQETARVWDGIVAALEIGDSDADVVKTITDMQAEIIALRAERAKLEAALLKASQYVIDWLDAEYHLPCAAELLDEIDAALAQPAESGATERSALDVLGDQRVGVHIGPDGVYTTGAKP